MRQGARSTDAPEKAAMTEHKKLQDRPQPVESVVSVERHQQLRNIVVHVKADSGGR